MIRMEAMADTDKGFQTSEICSRYEKLREIGKELFQKFSWPYYEETFNSEEEMLSELSLGFGTILRDYVRGHPEVIDATVEDMFLSQEGACPKHGKKNFVLRLYPDGTVYEGEILSGLRHGPGKCRFVKGGVYVGQWKKDKKNGIGTLLYADGSVYDGQFKNDKRHGRGYQLYKKKIASSQDSSAQDEKSGGIYDGEWKNSRRHGIGIFHYADGSWYRGEWNRGNKHGHGVKVNADGSYYKGEWKDGKEDGYGFYQFSNGSTYEGEWTAGFRHGKGIFQCGDSQFERVVFAPLVHQNCCDEKSSEDPPGMFRTEDGSLIIKDESAVLARAMDKIDWSKDTTFAPEVALPLDKCIEDVSREEEEASKDEVELNSKWSRSSSMGSLLDAIPHFQIDFLPSMSESPANSIDATTRESSDLMSVVTFVEDDADMVQHVVGTNNKYEVLCPSPQSHLKIRLASAANKLRRSLSVFKTARSKGTALSLVASLHEYLVQAEPSGASDDLLEALRAIVEFSDAFVINHRDAVTLDTLLHAVCRLNLKEAVRILLDSGLVNVNDRDQMLCTSLTVAVKTHMNPEIMRALLDHGANPRLRDKEGLSALQYLAMTGLDWKEITRGVLVVPNK